MAGKRKQYDPAFKAKVALEAVRGIKTLTELATEHQLHPTLIATRKQALLNYAPELFQDRRGASKGKAHAAQVDELLRVIGTRQTNWSGLKKSGR